MLWCDPMHVTTKYWLVDSQNNVNVLPDTQVIASWRNYDLMAMVYM